MVGLIVVGEGFTGVRVGGLCSKSPGILGVMVVDLHIQCSQ